MRDFRTCERTTQQSIAALIVPYFMNARVASAWKPKCEGGSHRSHSVNVSSLILLSQHGMGEHIRRGQRIGIVRRQSYVAVDHEIVHMSSRFQCVEGKGPPFAGDLNFVKHVCESQNLTSSSSHGIWHTVMRHDTAKTLLNHPVEPRVGSNLLLEQWRAIRQLALNTKNATSDDCLLCEITRPNASR